MKASSCTPLILEAYLMPNRELLHHNEEARLDALHHLQILDTPIEERYERYTRLACKAFDMPISTISCIDEHRQWFKSIQGGNTVETERCVSFCQHTILEDEALIVNDARCDERFATSPLVCNDPGIVFYAGVPILSPDGLPLAAFCVIDTKPRSFTQTDLNLLKDFAKLVEHEMTTQSLNPIEHQLTNLIGGSWRVSLIDPLTRLWNHEGISTIIDEALNLSSKTNIGFCVAMVDLSRFDEINKTLGHVAGDEILRSFSKSLLSEIGEDNSLGRIRNNEFLILFNSVTEMDQVEAVLDRIESFVDSFPVKGIEGRETLGGAVVGVYVPPKWTGSLKPLLDQIDETMHKAKIDDHLEPRVIEVRSLSEFDHPETGFADEQAV